MEQIEERINLVGLAGFEPTTSSSRTMRATNCAIARGVERNETECLISETMMGYLEEITRMTCRLYKKDI